MQRTIARHLFGLILALAGLTSSITLMMGPARVASAQTVAPGWSHTGNLNRARYSVPATLLPNGKVLIAGGDYIVSDLTAELYDPTTGSWSTTGSATWARGPFVWPPGTLNITATLLPNGKVLVAGGSMGDGCFPTAELYDSTAGTWSTTGSLKTARESHTATLLPNGKVLVAGGFDYDSASLNSAELYDPATGLWSNTGSLKTPRVFHTATLLPNGKVLVAGGFDGPGYDDDPGHLDQSLDSAELYDPDTGIWSSTGNLNTALLHHTATLLPSGKVLVAGGADNQGAHSAEVYDPATGTWGSTGDLNRARAGHTATLLPSGQVLAVGGDSNGRSADLYDPATGTWSITASTDEPLFGPATLLPNGKVLVTNYDRTAELYDPGTNATPNLIDDPQFFVRQHYRDFLNREPDANGLAFWTNEIALCGGDAQCVDAKRINVSASYFLSIEFQQTGYLVYRTYEASYGNLPSAPVPLKLSEFQFDTQKIGKGVVVNQTGWETVLENNQQAFMLEFVQRPTFASAFTISLTPAEFVDQLFANAGVTPSASDRLAAISDFGSATTTSDQAGRSRALRRVAENSTLTQQEFNRAFVLMQYFGYLRRNPNDAPDLNFDGYNFWLTKLNSFNGNFINAEMVKAFIQSDEYRHRFEQGGR